MNITSAFAQGESIPEVYTCDGENISPPLMFIDVPPDAQSLALIMYDPDVPKSFKPDGLFTHWLVWDMPPDVREIPEDATAPGVIGDNSAGRAEYTGPCPPEGTHRYFLKLYALDVPLTDARIADKSDLEKAIEGHVMEEAELMGTYTRKTK